MRAIWSSLMLAVTMAALALFAGGHSSVRGHGEAARSSLHDTRHDDATTVTAPRPGPGGALYTGGRKSSRSTPLRLQVGAAIVPYAAHLSPPRLQGPVSAVVAERPTPRAPARLHLARAPPV